MNNEKVFKFTHLCFNTETEYKESELPTYLRGKEHLWFLNKHVLTLGVGQYVDTDFNRITRLA
jgi:hypothetical protein